MSTKLVSVRKSDLAKREYSGIREWLDEGNVYIGKAVPKLGIKCSKWLYDYIKGGGGNYREYIINNMYDQLDELVGRELGCYCKNLQECHGMVLVELLEEKQLSQQVSKMDLHEVHESNCVQEIVDGMSKVNIKCGCRGSCLCNAYRNWLMRNHGITYEEEMERADKIYSDKIFGRYEYKNYPQYTGEGY